MRQQETCSIKRGQTIYVLNTEPVFVCGCACTSNLISASEEHLLSTHAQTQVVAMGTKQPLYTSMVGEWAGVGGYCAVCVLGVGVAVLRGVGWVGGGNIKQRTRQMKALNILKSNHNLVITRK